MIERADNRATRVFGVGFSFAMMMLAPMLLVLLAMAASLLGALVFGDGHALDVFGVLITLVLLPWMLASLADRRLAPFLSRHPQAASVVGLITSFYSRIGFGPRGNALVALFASHAGRRRFAVIALLVIMPVAAAITVQATAARGRLPFGMSMGLRGADPFSPTSAPIAFYADERGDGYAAMPLPYLRSRVVQGPYLQLFVPFIPRLHGAALPKACPGLVEPAPDDRARLDCLASMLAIELDGAAVAVQLDASTDPGTGQPGMLAMIPVRALPAGRHELSLLEPDRRALDGPASRRYRIPFWK